MIPLLLIQLHLLNISTSRLTERRDRVDGGDPLSQESICSELGQLCAPQIGGQDPLLGHPVLIDLPQHPDCSLATGCFLASNQYLSSKL